MTQTTVVAWAEKPAPRDHWIMASYTVMDTLQLFRTCKRGCCADAGIGSQVLPHYWRDATPEELHSLDWRTNRKVAP